MASGSGWSWALEADPIVTSRRGIGEHALELVAAAGECVTTL
jgi:hypothetical protein